VEIVTTSDGKPMKGSPKARGPLGRPFPWWATLLALLVPALAIEAVYAVVTGPLGGDWAYGAQIAGIVALGLAGVALVMTLLRVVLGRRALSAVGLGLALVVLLGAVGSSGLLGGQQLHLAQAGQLERAGRWSTAIHEYTLAGQSAPSSGDIARVYDEWGESDFQRQLYPAAIVQFNTVISDYSGAGAYVTRADHDLYQTYSDWITSGGTDVDYPSALLFLGQYKVGAQCDAGCLSAANDIQTQAYYQYGVKLANQGEYLLAITQFESAQALLPGSQYALLAHQAAAPVYYSLGQQDLNAGDCTDAVTTYRTLVSSYQGTSQAQQAGQALAAPVQVTGNLTNYAPTGYTPTAYLSKTANAPNSKNAPFGSFYFSRDYSTSLASSGAYTFSGVAPGNYTLSVVGATTTSWWSNTSDGSLYFFPVSPLCGAQVKTLDGTLIR